MTAREEPEEPEETGGDTAETRTGGIGVKVADLATGEVVTARGAWSLKRVARTMHEHGIGSVVVVDADGSLCGILTERDLLRAVATEDDLDEARVDAFMSTEVVVAAPDWEVYEAAAAMTEHHIRHLVVQDDTAVVGVLSVRDVLLAGQRVELTDGAWAVLRDPLTFSVRERRQLQRGLLEVGGGSLEEADLDRVTAALVGSWSFDEGLPADASALAELSESDRRLLRAAVLEELPGLQRAVHPAPGWRGWDE